MCFVTGSEFALVHYEADVDALKLWLVSRTLSEHALTNVENAVPAPKLITGLFYRGKSCKMVESRT